MGKALFVNKGLPRTGFELAENRSLRFIPVTTTPPINLNMYLFKYVHGCSNGKDFNLLVALVSCRREAR